MKQLGRKPFENRDEVRSHLIQIKVTKTEKEQLKTLAFEDMQTIGAFIRTKVGLVKDK